MSHENLTIRNSPSQEIEGIFNPFIGRVRGEKFDTFEEENIQSEVAVVHIPVFNRREAMISL
jgi:hypothetical protein